MSGNASPWGPDKPDQPPGSSPVGWLILGALGFVGLMGFLVWRFPDTIAGQADWMRLVVYVVFACMVGGWLIIHWWAQPSQALKQAGLWGAIVGVLVLG